MALTKLLTYTIEWLDVSLPFGNVAVSLAKKAPSSRMGEWLAAARLSLTGCRSSRENPQARKSSMDHRSDCAAVSAFSDRVTWLRWTWPSVLLAGLSTEMVMVTLEWSLSWARLHSPLVKMWCSSLVGVGPLAAQIALSLCLRQERFRRRWLVFASKWCIAVTWDIGSDSIAWILAGCGHFFRRRTL